MLTPPSSIDMPCIMTIYRAFLIALNVPYRHTIIYRIMRTLGLSSMLRLSGSVVVLTKMVTGKTRLPKALNDLRTFEQAPGCGSCQRHISLLRTILL